MPELIITDDMLRDQACRLDRSMAELGTVIDSVNRERNRMREALEALIGELDPQIRPLQIYGRPDTEHHVVITHALWQQLEAALS